MQRDTANNTQLIDTNMLQVAHAAAECKHQSKGQAQALWYAPTKLTTHAGELCDKAAQAQDNTHS
jgi:hypothetical protein